MGKLPFSVTERAMRYIDSRGLSIAKQLGGGFDGVVFATQQGTAIKSLNYDVLYRPELDVYLHLRKLMVQSVKGFQVPTLVNSDDSLMEIEMSIVMPPYVLDFSGASLVKPQQFPDDIRAEWKEQRKELFGEDWPLVQTVIWAFEGMEVYLNDVHLGNVCCRIDS